MTEPWNITYQHLKQWQQAKPYSAWKLRSILTQSQYFPLLAKAASQQDPHKPPHIAGYDWWFYSLPLLEEHLAIQYMLYAWNKDLQHFLLQESQQCIDHLLQQFNLHPDQS